MAPLNRGMGKGKGFTLLVIAIHPAPRGMTKQFPFTQRTNWDCFGRSPADSEVRSLAMTAGRQLSFRRNLVP
ncbi:MAG: hypothetical protein C4532_17465 [Candidatus Abyssobacteria bacterium SURF_17]|uniref:Uncharacterized protein n=1 Tax=Candidatus Abyssobacteria bacterium SURF_17 TaxID=2093361 RepID=A0A419EQL4_9BACT|nr:MAG: hypothetical protein C4532_17465 [Candidatus Abyssubacteria bacterium SURF_17]